MLDILKELIVGEHDGDDDPVMRTADPVIAASALMVKTALADGCFDQAEWDIIVDRMSKLLKADHGAVADLIGEVRETPISSQDVERFAFSCGSRYSPKDRRDMLEYLWQVAFADGVLDEAEADLVHKVATHLGFDRDEATSIMRRGRARLDGW